MPRIIYMHADAASESGSVLKKLNVLLFSEFPLDFRTLSSSNGMLSRIYGMGFLSRIYGIENGYSRQANGIRVCAPSSNP